MNKQITIGFTLEDRCGNVFSQSSTVEVFDELGDTELDTIGTQFNTFLKQCGYTRYNDNILMEDLSDDEYDAIIDYLDDLRADAE